MGNEKVDVRLVLSIDRERSSRPLSYVLVGRARCSLLPARHLNLLKNFKLWNPTWNPATQNSNNKNLKCQELIFSFCDALWNGIVQSIYDLATACTIRVSNPTRGSRFCFLHNKKFKPVLGPVKRPVDHRIQVVLIRRGQSFRGMTITTHLQPMSKLRIIGAIPLLLLYDFIACIRITLHSKKKLFGKSSIKIYKGLLLLIGYSNIEYCGWLDATRRGWINIE